MHELVDVTVDAIAAGGDGVARAEGCVVFVPRTAPGDLVRVHLERHKRFARGEVDTLLRASAVRVEPPCPHYVVDRCGGCQLQHVTYAAQLDAKAGIIADALQRIAKQTVPRPAVVPSGSQWRYRRKLTLGMRAADGGWIIGLHPYDDPVGLFMLADCPITDERVVASWREIIGAMALFPVARELRASVRLVDDGTAVVMQGGADWPTREEFFEAVPSMAALWWTPLHGQRRLVRERVPSPGGASFAQINEAIAARLNADVVERVLAHAPEHVIDAYAGTGDTAAAVAAAGVRVTAIEADVDAAARCAARLPPPSRSMASRVEDILPRALPADVIVLNPPRTGLDARVCHELQRTARPPRGLIYVSCDPATLARDIARMPRYRIASVLGFDMFPQTAHVETVCELVPEAV